MLKARDASNAARAITGVKVRDSGNVSRPLAFIKVRDAGGVLRTVFAALSASASPTTVLGYGYSNGPSDVLTENTTASASGGGSFTFVWSRTDGGSGTWSAVYPTSATTSFVCAGLGPGDSSVATFQCAVTDSFGNTAIAGPVDAQCYNYGEFV